MSIEEAIREFTSLSGFYKDSGNIKDAVDHQQIANWLQELKERREKESRREEVIRDPDAKYVTKDMTEEACEAMVRLIEKIIEILPDVVASVTENMPEAIEQYIESKIRNGKEEK